MFKEENRIWWYIVGVIIIVILLFIVGRDYVLPILRGQKSVFELQQYTYTRPPEFTIDNSQDYYWDLHTSVGKITIDLYEKAAPNNVNNVAFLTGRGYYNGTKFHRLFPDFMVQGGDRNTLDAEPLNDGLGGPGYFLDDEINWDSLGLSAAKREELSAKGYTSANNLESVPLQSFTVAMASTSPNTNGSQFFIVIAEPGDSRLSLLNGYFTVIGRVVDGGEFLAALRYKDVDTSDPNLPRPIEEIVLQEAVVYTK